jgi:hypothetical protein
MNFMSQPHVWRIFVEILSSGTHSKLVAIQWVRQSTLIQMLMWVSHKNLELITRILEWNIRSDCDCSIKAYTLGEIRFIGRNIWNRSYIWICPYLWQFFICVNCKLYGNLSSFKLNVNYINVFSLMTLLNWHCEANVFMPELKSAFTRIHARGVLLINRLLVVTMWVFFTNFT